MALQSYVAVEAGREISRGGGLVGASPTLSGDAFGSRSYRPVCAGIPPL